jgi:uncharacterized protein YjbI with pentapeptide repeats
MDTHPNENNLHLSMKRQHWTIVTLLVLGIVAVNQGTTYVKQRVLMHRLLSSKACEGCDLSGLNLAGLDLSNTTLKGANLQGANLQGTQLNNADFTDANLSQANLTDADFGCTTVNFNLKADQGTANMDLTVDATSPEAIQQRDHILDFNFDADSQGATMRFNFGGCATLSGANLTGAKMPDGKSMATDGGR